MIRQITTLFVATLVVAGAFTAGAAAASAPSISAASAEGGATTTYTATITVGESSTGSLNGLQVDLSNAGSDVSNVGVENVKTVGIDKGDDSSGAAVDTAVSDDLESADVSNNGHTVTFTFGGSYELQQGDEVVVVFENVQNPDSPSESAVPIDINPQSSGGQAEATISFSASASVGGSAGDATDTATGDNGGDDAQGGSTDSADAGASGGATVEASGESKTSAPGFGAALAVVALLAAALLATRR